MKLADKFRVALKLPCVAKKRYDSMGEAVHVAQVRTQAAAPDRAKLHLPIQKLPGTHYSPRSKSRVGSMTQRTIHTNPTQMAHKTLYLLLTQMIGNQLRGRAHGAGRSAQRTQALDHPGITTDQRQSVHPHLGFGLVPSHSPTARQEPHP